MKFVEIYTDMIFTVTGILAAVLKFVIDSKCAKGFILMVGVTLIAWLVFHDGEVLGSLAAVCVVLFATIFIENSDSWRN